MQAQALPVLKDIVLLGAGHAHVTVLKKFGMKPVPGVRLTLITREVHTPYSGMLPGYVAGVYGFDDIHIDTAPLCRLVNARLYQAEATGIDTSGKRVLLADRPPVPYDFLSIDIGSTPGGRKVPGASDFAIPVKPIDRFLRHLDAATDKVLASRAPMRVGVVGGGPAGVELILSLRERFRNVLEAANEDPNRLSFVLFSAQASVLPGIRGGIGRRLTRILSDRGVEITTGARVSGIEGGSVVLESGRRVPFDLLFWTTEAAPAPWLSQSGLALDPKGFISVTSTLQSASHPEVFAAGDVASLTSRALPKSGVYAVRQGPFLADNLRRAVEGRPLKPFKPQREALYLISTGNRYAVGTRNGVSFEGAWAWRWKDRIDRAFMRKFNELPQMVAAGSAPTYGIVDKDAIKEISAIAMRCGGCGAKVGANVLSRALNAIEPAMREDVVIGLDAPDDAAVVDTGGPKLAVQTVDYFRAIVDDPYVFGKIAANHALGDIYAMGGEPQTALAIATIPYGLEAKVEATLSDLMTGANEVLREAGCALVGGHTSEGAELALGFAVNGLVGRTVALRKGGLKPGDALILMKPIGTGTLLAADMRGKAKARWVMAALRHMTISNREAARILSRYSVSAATDVTGFGLLGHLVEMVRASGTDARINLPDVPVLDGARETVAAGVFSSLQPQNIRLRRAIRNLGEASRDPSFPLLFDPQTAGGLLASLPKAQARQAVAELRAAGYADAALIGVVLPNSDDLEPITIGFQSESSKAISDTETETTSGRTWEEKLDAH